MKFKEDSGRDSNDFLKLKDGGEIIGVCVGELIDYQQHWVGSKSELCPEDGTCDFCKKGQKSSFRFRVNFVVKEKDGYVAKLLEQGWRLYKDLRSLHKEYDLQKHLIKITRTGSGQNDTSYSVIPVKNGALDVAKLETISKVKLHDLKSEPKSSEPEAPKFNAEEEVPF